MKNHLPFTFRNNLTIDSVEYRELANIELQRLKEKGLNTKTIIRLETILDQTQTTSDVFEICSFMSPDGHGIYYNKWNVRSPKHVFIFLNGLESHAGWFDDLADSFVSENIRTYALDRRGSGLNSRHCGTFQNWIDDITEVTKIAKDENPRAKIHLVSICFGAKPATACAIQNPGQYDSLIYMSPGLKVKVAPTPKEKLMITADKFPRAYFNIRTPIKLDEMFTSNTKALYFLYKDKLRTHSPRASDFFQAMMLNLFISKNLEKMKTPSLALLAGNDRIVNNHKTMDILNKFKQQPKIIEYPDSDHVIFFGKSKEEMQRDILNFLISEI